MSLPYGASQQASQPSGSPGQAAGGGPDLKFILTAVAGGAGAVGYLLGFFDSQAAADLSGMAGFSFIVAAALAGMRLLPGSPNTLFPAAPLALYAALALLQATVSGGSSGIVVFVLLLAVVQLASLVGALLLESGLVDPSAFSRGSQQQAPARPGQFSPPQSGPFPQPGPGQSGPQGQGPHQPGQQGPGPQGQGQPGPLGQGPRQPGPQGPGQQGPNPQAPNPQAPNPQGPGPQGQGRPQAPGPQGPQPSGPQPGGWVPAPPPNEQPGGWNPPSDPGGSAGTADSPGQQGNPQSGPQGTQQMPHPGASPRDF